MNKKWMKWLLPLAVLGAGAAGMMAISATAKKTDEVAEIAEQTGESVETAARRLRYEFFARMSGQHGAKVVYLAHHAEGQAETVLAHLCRGAGLNGLAGMKPEQKLKGLLLKRPLLTWRRDEINAYVHEHRLPFRDDASNASPAHRRNRIRREALPLLAEIFDRDVTPQITQFAEWAAMDADALDQMSKAFLKDENIVEEDHSLRITPELKKLHPALLSRVLRHWLRSTCSVSDIGTAEVTAAIGLLSQTSPAKINLPGDKHLRRKSGHLEVLSA